MKKLIVLSVIFILAAGAVFAQMAPGLWMNAWGRAAFVPMWYQSWEYIYGEDNLKTEGEFYNGTGTTWSTPKAPRVDFRIQGANDHLGFMVQVNAEAPGAVGNGDNGAHLWVKPFGNEYLRLLAGNYFMEDRLRGKVHTDTGFENFILSGQVMGASANDVEPLNPDVIFTRFAGGRGGSGPDNSNTSTWVGSALPNAFFVTSSPIDGLFLGLMLQGTFPNTKLKESWRQVHAGAGYEIKNVGLVRAQYFGGYVGKEKGDEDPPFKPEEPAKIETAFAYTALRNMVVDLGLKIWLPTTTSLDTKYFRGIDIGLGVFYRYQAFSISGMAQAKYLGSYGTFPGTAHTVSDDAGKDGMQLTLNFIPSYDFDFATVGLSLVFTTKTANKGIPACVNCGSTDCAEKQTAWTQFGLGAWIKKGYAGGYIKTGITWTPAPIETGHYIIPGAGGPGTLSPEARTGFNGRGIVTIPIIFEYAFF